MRAKGYGTFNAETKGISVINGKIDISPEVEEKIAKYTDFIINDKSGEWLYLLTGGKSNGKRTD